MKSLVLAGVSSCLFTILAGKLVIPILKRAKAGQPVYEYVKEHQEKNGTPTMGGLFFIIPTALVFLILGGIKGRIATVGLTIGLSYMTVGFLDDFIKIKTRKNQGLKAYQKIIFQTAIALFAGVFAYTSGLTVFHLPFTQKNLDLGYFTIPIIAFVFIAITNSVNLTDGLDGLAGNVSLVYLVFMTLLIGLQTSVLSSVYFVVYEYEQLELLAVCLIGGLAGFLVYNTNKAKVFMGDTGSLSLGGFIGAISIFSSNSFFVPLIGIMFVASSISVIMQVARFKHSGKRFFIKAPLHHHFQLKGVSESKISYVYSLITALLGSACLVAYL